MAQEEEKRQAQERAQALFEQGYKAQMAGDLEGAVRLYKASLETSATAEAYTFLGWTYSMQGHLDEAIGECEKAIALDPEFGNAWNDIGAYYIQKNEFDKAVPYLERAKKAGRYECRAFPHCNLARVWIQKGMLRRAIEELEEAVALDPSYEMAQKMLKKVRFDLN